jgi:hypothetical protein
VLLLMVWLAVILPGLTGCVASTIAPVVVSDYCRIARPIPYDSTRDSAETVADIEAHNSRWECVCNHDCPKPEA